MAKNSIESKLLDEPVRRLQLGDYCIVTADTTVRETVERMREMGQNCAFIVGEHTRLVGILIGRDVLNKVVMNPETWDEPVMSIIDEAPMVVSQDSAARDALRMMEKNQARNMPVVQKNGIIVGNVTHYAILKFLTDHFPEVVYNLPPDPYHYAKRRDGG